MSTESHPMPKGRLTLTGADERTNVTELREMTLAGIEIGLLYTTTPEGRPRYPRWDWIREASLELRCCALHACGSGARKALLDGTLPVSGFQRIQVNGTISAGDVKHLCALYPSHTIVTQFTHGNKEHLLVPASNHALLMDESGGRGISPEAWGAPDTDKAVGFAGGLGHDNIEREVAKIRMIARPGWWVDMEGKLRTGSVNQREDWFSLENAWKCCTAFNYANR